MAELKKGWKRVKFGDVVRLNGERCANPLAEGIERYVGLEHLEPGDLRVRSWGNVADGTTFTNRFKPGQVLFGKRRAYQKKVAIADFEGVCSGDIYVFESADPKRLLPELLPFICQTDAFFEYAVGTSAGSLSPRTNWTSLAEYEFALPPVEEQRRLGIILLALMEALVSASELCDAATRLWSALTTNFFESNAALLRADISSLCDVVSVGIVNKPAEYYTDEEEDGVPALIMKNVKRGYLDLSDLNHISRKGHELNSKSILRAGDVVAVRSSGSEERTGDAAVIPTELDGVNCIDLLLMRPGRSLRADFLCAFLNAPWTRRQLLAGSTGTMQKHLNVGALKQLRLPLLRLDQQDDIIIRLQAVEAAARTARHRSEQARLIHQQLLNSSFGEP